VAEKKNYDGRIINAEHEQEVEIMKKASQIAFDWEQSKQEIIVSKQ
jgi:hypothetical protein